jgi:hypothetical protein
MMARNVTCKVEGTTLTLTVDLSAKGSMSASGKSEVIATTSGNLDVPGAEGVKVGLNVFRAADLGKVKGAGW